MNDEQINKAAKVLWDYLQLHQAPNKSDAIFVLCSMDTRVAERGAELFKQGLGDYLIISGGCGKLTKDVFDKPEAQVFKDVAISKGVPAGKIIIEDKSTNTGENVRFTYNVLHQRDLSPHSFILVQKPYMERRAHATFMKQWPGREVEITVTSPQLPYDNYFNEACPKELVLNIMVGDMQRIKEYAEQGLQIKQDIPASVWDAYERLVSAGYSSHVNAVLKPNVCSARIWFEAEHFY
jgi:uncharacterized SAM-binding protein YcdF (DUF218 family)